MWEVTSSRTRHFELQHGGVFRMFPEFAAYAPPSSALDVVDDDVFADVSATALHAAAIGEGAHGAGVGAGAGAGAGAAGGDVDDHASDGGAAVAGGDEFLRLDAEVFMGQLLALQSRERSTSSSSAAEGDGGVHGDDHGDGDTLLTTAPLANATGEGATAPDREVASGATTPADAAASAPAQRRRDDAERRRLLAIVLGVEETSL